MPIQIESQPFIFEQSLSAVSLSGVHYGDGSRLTGVSGLPIYGTVNQITATAANNSVTISLPSNVNITTLNVLSTLNVAGSANFYNTNNLNVSSNIIYFGEGNTANALDLGLVTHFVDGTNNRYQHTGLARKAGQSSPGVWTLFSGLTTEPGDANSGINWNDPYLTVDTLSANIYGNLSGRYVTVGTGNSNQWNSAYNIATAYQSSSGSFATNALLQSTSALLTPLTLTNNLTSQLVQNTIINNLTGNWNTAYQALSTNPYILNQSLSSTSTLIGSNTANNIFAEVLGGSYNTASGLYSTIVGGYSSCNTGNFSFVGAGSGNKVTGAFSVIGGGCNNLAGGVSVGGSVVGGGIGNQANANYATVAGGTQNCATCANSFVGGGSVNKATGASATVAGGSSNLATSSNATIGGGVFNYVCGSSSTLAGGFCNAVCGNTSVIAGGVYNTICSTGTSSGIVGGVRNTVSGVYSTIVGGRYNFNPIYNSDIHGGVFNHTGGFTPVCVTTVGLSGNGTCTQLNFGVNCTSCFSAPGVSNLVSLFYATPTNPLSAGCFATASICTNSGNCLIISGDFTSSPTASATCIYVYDRTLNQGGCNAFIGSGILNTASGLYNTVVSGKCNTASACYGFIGGGTSNCSLGSYTTVLGGICNRAPGSSSAILNGVVNSACGGQSAIINGTSNVAEGCRSFIANGTNNCVASLTNAQNSSILGGTCNVINGCGGYLACCSIIGGGCYNVVASNFSTIVGGRGNHNPVYNSDIHGGAFNHTGGYAQVNITFGPNLSGNGSCTALCATGINTCFSNSGTNNAVTVVYATSGTANSSLSSALVATANLITNAAGCIIISGDYSACSTGLSACSIWVYDRCLNIGGCNNFIGGGIFNTASGCYSVIGGGKANITSAAFSTVAGGTSNTAGVRSVVAGGAINSASGYISTVGGGANNTSSGAWSTIGGGSFNTANGLCFAAVGGGQSNTASGLGSVVAGGIANTSSGLVAAVLGGTRNTSSGAYSLIGGGCCNTITTTGSGSFIGGGKYNYNPLYNSNIIGGSFNHTGGYTPLNIVTGTALSGNGACSCICGLNIQTYFSSIAANAINAYYATATNPLSTGTYTTATIVASGTNYVIFNKDFSACSTGLSATSLYLYDSTVNLSGCNNFIGGGALNTASGCYGVVVGGICNAAVYNHSVVGGGCKNTNSTLFGFIGGGICNYGCSCAGFIGAGCNNTFYSHYSFIGGGTSNSISTFADCSVIVGGQANSLYNCGNSVGSVIVGGVSNKINSATVGAASNCAFLGGGYSNCLIGNSSVIAGGCINFVCGNYTSIVGGTKNTASGNYSFIAGGSANDTKGFANTFILGTGLSATAPNATYVNNLVSLSSVAAPYGTFTTSATVPSLTATNILVNNNVNTTSLSTNNIYGSGTTALFSDGSSQTTNGNNTFTITFSSGVYVNSPILSASGAVYSNGIQTVVKAVSTIGDGTSTSFNFVHNLNTRDIHTQVYSTTNYTVVYPTITNITLSSVNISFSSPPALTAYRVVVTG